MSSKIICTFDCIERDAFSRNVTDVNGKMSSTYTQNHMFDVCIVWFIEGLFFRSKTVLHIWNSPVYRTDHRKSNKLARRSTFFSMIFFFSFSRLLNHIALKITFRLPGCRPVAEREQARAS